MDIVQVAFGPGSVRCGNGVKKQRKMISVVWILNNWGSRSVITEIGKKGRGTGLEDGIV